MLTRQLIEPWYRYLGFNNYNFVEVVRDMFEALKKYTVFSDRVRRKECWLFKLFAMVCGLFAQILDSIMQITVSQDNIGVRIDDGCIVSSSCSSS